MFDSYGRLSWNPNTQELEKIEDQHEDNLRVIDRLGGTLGETLSDGLSAWKRSVKRQGWERLLARVESGESDGIVVWHTDRKEERDRLAEQGEERPTRLAGVLVSVPGGLVVVVFLLHRCLGSPQLDRDGSRVRVAHTRAARTPRYSWYRGLPVVSPAGPPRPLRPENGWPGPKSTAAT